MFKQPYVFRNFQEQDEVCETLKGHCEDGCPFALQVQTFHAPPLPSSPLPSLPLGLL